MSEPTFYIVTACHSFVLAAVSGPRPVVVQEEGAQDKAQKWTVEYGDKPDVIAMRCVGNGRYLGAVSGGAGAIVDMQEKQYWWKLSRDELCPSTAFKICSVASPQVLLNHHDGDFGYNPDRLVHMWPWVPSRPSIFSFFFKDTTATFDYPGKASAGNSTKAQELATKEQALQQRETALAEEEKDIATKQAKLEDLEQREAAVAQNEQSSSAKEAKLAKLKDQLDADRADYEKGKGTAAQPDKTQSEEDNKQQQANLQRKTDELRVNERDLAARQARLDKKQQQNKAKEDELKRKEARLASAPASGGPTDVDLLKAENANLKLHLRITELEKELEKSARNASQPAPVDNKGSNSSALVSDSSSAPSGHPTPASNSKTDIALTDNSGMERTFEHGNHLIGEKEQPVTVSCDHIFYAPPRKIRRKIIGIMYA